MLTGIERRTGLGGSDAAKVLGISPWGDPLTLWMEKRGLITTQRRSSEAMHWGTVLEDAVAREYARRTGQKLWNPARTRRHRTRTWMFGHADRLVRPVSETSRGLEIKCIGRFSRESWGADGSDQVPAHYRAQCAHYQALYGCDFWDMAVLFGGQEMRIYHLVRDRELERHLIQAEAEFWKSVVTGTAPEGQGPTAESTIAYLKSLFPAEQSPARPASGAETALAMEWRRLHARALDCRDQIGWIKSQIMESMGDTEKISGPFGSLIWRKDRAGNRPLRPYFRPPRGENKR